MKGYAMLVLFMHRFYLMNPKGEKNWKIDQIKSIEALKLELKSNLNLNPYY